MLGCFLITGGGGHGGGGGYGGGHGGYGGHDKRDLDNIYLARPDFSNLPVFEKNFYFEHPAVSVSHCSSHSAAPLVARGPLLCVAYVVRPRVLLLASN